MLSRYRVVPLLLTVMALIAAACGDDTAPTTTASSATAQGSDATLEDLQELVTPFLTQGRVDVDLEVSRQFPEPELAVDPIVIVEHRFRWDDAGPQGIGRTQIDAGELVVAVDFRIVDGTVWEVTTPSTAAQWNGRPFTEPLEELAGIGPFDSRLVLAAILDSAINVRSVSPRGAGGSVWDLNVDATALALVALPPDDGGEQLELAPDTQVVLELQVNQFGQPVDARADLDVWWTAAMLAQDPALESELEMPLRMQFRAAFAAGEPALAIEAPCVPEDPAAPVCPFEG